MAPKVPSDQTLERGLADAVRRIWNSDEKADLSVNLVRQRVAEELELEDGFFKGEEWKARSKQVIKEAVDELDNAAPKSSQVSAAPSPKPTAKNGYKSRQKKATQSKPSKPSKIGSTVKRKRSAKKSASGPDEDEDEEEEDSAEDTLSDAPSEEAPPKKKAKPAAKPKAKPAPKPAPKPKSKPDKATIEAKPQNASPKKQEEFADSSLSDVDSDEVKDAATNEAKAVSKDEEVSSSEESVVIDEPPKKKRRGKEASSAGTVKPKSKAKAPAELDPDEAEVKKLQGQLVKCGVRKIWAFELKEYGDNTKAKIRHLRNLLKELGMDGRFSEAKAREIKERRELEADLEAVKEMDENWGAGRASRSRAARNSLKEPSDEEAGDADGNVQETKDNSEDSETGEKANPRAKGSARYRADFAFLNDDDESDSD